MVTVCGFIIFLILLLLLLLLLRAFDSGVLGSTKVARLRSNVHEHMLSSVRVSIKILSF